MVRIKDDADDDDDDDDNDTSSTGTVANPSTQRDCAIIEPTTRTIIRRRRTDFL